MVANSLNNNSSIFERGLKYYFWIAVLTLFSTILIVIVLPQIADEETMLIFQAIIYAIYFLAMLYIVYIYYKQSVKTKAVSTEIKNEVDSSEPMYMLKYLSEYGYEKSANPGQLSADDPRSHFIKGNALIEKDLLKEAIIEYTEVIRLNPDHYMAHNNLGNIYLKNNMVDAATKEFLASIRIKPDDYQALSNLGIACMLSRKYEDAVTVMKESIRLKPDYLVAHNNLGAIYYKTGLYDEAIKEFEISLRIDAANKEARHNYDMCVEMKKLKGKVMETIKK